MKYFLKEHEPEFSRNIFKVVTLKKKKSIKKIYKSTVYVFKKSRKICSRLKNNKEQTGLVKTCNERGTRMNLFIFIK